MIRGIIFMPVFIVSLIIILIILAMYFIISLFFYGDAPQPPQFVWTWAKWVENSIDKIIKKKQ